MDRSQRKIDHIANALSTTQQSTNGLNDIQFVHQSLPNTSLESVNLETNIGELSLSSPFLINGMTGGGGDFTYKINKQLSLAAAHYNIPIAVGSMMSALKDPSEAYTFKVVREVNPNGVLLANLGAEATVEQAERAVELISANAIQIHLNAIQELIMPEGDRDFTKWIENLEAIVTRLNVPVIVKEVGFGMSYETASLLQEIGVTIIDIGGYGGTNFSKIENMRRGQEIEGFNSWGIKTAVSIAEVSSTMPTLPLIASGGIHNAFDIAKTIALGASAVGFARTFLQILIDNDLDTLINHIATLQNELKLIMTGLGVNTIKALQDTPVIISGETFHWLHERGIDTKRYSQRNSFL